jgi:4-hydroxy-3-polyprenylbenzoate decarboxylase
VHLENMTRLTRAGAVIMPASPGFYHRPQRVEEMVDFVVARVLDHLDLDIQVGPRWQGDEER